MKKTVYWTLWLIGSLWGMASESFGQTKPVWKFSVLAAVEKQTAAYFEKKYAKPIASIVREQMATVNAHFNSTDKFKGIFAFTIDSVYVVEGSFQNDLFKAHPTFDYKVVIDGYAASTSGGGWYGDNKLIYHKWMWNDNGGPFEQYATDGLTHEYAHARGAVDIYGMRVDSTKNSVNGKAFDAINSIMNYPYGNITWDEHTVNLLNRTGASPVTDEFYITSAFPKKIVVRMKDAWGNPVKQGLVNLYPVSWFSYSVTRKPLENFTDAQGQITLANNPFNPGYINAPWHIQYPNFLVSASYGPSVYQTWLPLYEVQNHYFKYGADSTFILDINLTAKPASLRIYTTNDTLFCTGETLTSYSYNEGSFGQTNQFSLQLSDSKGSFQSPTILQTGDPLRFPGDYPLKLEGTIPNLPTGNYKIRVVSSQPVVVSNEVPVSIQALPAAPLVSAVTTCERATAPLLNATGQNLRWYTTASGGNGSSTPPPLNTSKAGDTTYYVSQSIRGCESPRAALQITIRALPTMSLTGSSFIFLGEEAVLNLKFTGTPPYQYRLSNGLNGTATGDTLLLVSPKVTTTYTMEEVRNSCGTGTLQSPVSTQISVFKPNLLTQNSSPASLCPGGDFTVFYQIAGRLLPGTTFRLQIAREVADTSKYAFYDIPVVHTGTGELTGQVPDTLSAGRYRVRVVASNTLYELFGSIGETPLTVLSAPTATLTGAQEIFGRDTAQLSVAFTGEGPWKLTYRAVSDNSIGNEFSLTTSDNPYTLRVSPLITTAYYLTSVQNSCGSGAVTPEGIVVKVIPLLSAPASRPDPLVDVFPVPTSSSLTLRIRDFTSYKEVSWELHTLLGQVVKKQQVTSETSEFSLENLPAGLYMLRLRLGTNVVVHRIMKY